MKKPAKAKLKDKVANHKEEIDAQESPQHPRKEGDSYLEKWCKTSCLFVSVMNKILCHTMDLD